MTTPSDERVSLPTSRQQWQVAVQISFEKHFSEIVRDVIHADFSELITIEISCQDKCV
jgi:hypothetical protein